jgi:hypothetical protein
VTVRQALAGYQADLKTSGADTGNVSCSRGHISARSYHA